MSRVNIEHKNEIVNEVKKMGFQVDDMLMKLC